MTRPAPQAELLAVSLRAHGADAVVLPAIDIQPRTATTSEIYDLVVFASVNAVEHGAKGITRSDSTRIAAIGKATAAALEALEWQVDIVPERGFTSESLLAHPDLALVAGSRVLIVRGTGGREMLRQTFQEQGLVVDVLEVYERAMPQIDAARRDALEAAWRAGEIPVATATSVETLTHLLALLSEQGRELLKRVPLVVPSQRVRDAAVELGLQGDCIVAPAADDTSIVGALAQWHARARAAA
ncbi:uroporphyrinogen-III synthase [Povalibacter sp.]|uniref:uroporphyrinogen-III synthase n=1 Tax=Povalibacter sp. TaxID=1962978 RepID=UPI002F4151B3